MLWTTNERSADYSFNKSHAACYALISYRTAWLKANYPAEYMAALISSVMDTKDKVPFFVAQAEQMGIAILPPDVNLSDHEFVVVDGNIRFGLDAVKGVGLPGRGGDQDRARRRRRAAVPFTSLFDFCERVDNRAVNKKAIEALIKCGAFGSTNDSRKGMLMVLEQAQASGQKAQQDALIGQGSIFDLGLDLGDGDDGGAGNGAAGGFAGPTHAPIPGDEFDRTELLAAEKESLGLFISAHPLKEVGPALRAKADSTLAELSARRDGDWVTIGGMVTQAKKIKTKKGDFMMFATLYDLETSVEIIVFGKTLASCEDALQTDSIVLVRGKVDHKDRDTTCLIAQQVERFQPTEEEVLEAQVQAAKPVAEPQRAQAAPRRHRAARLGAGRAQGPALRVPGRVRRRHRAEHHHRAPAAEARPQLPRVAQRQPARRARRPAGLRAHARGRGRRRARAGARRRQLSPARRSQISRRRPASASMAARPRCTRRCRRCASRPQCRRGARTGFARRARARRDTGAS